MSDQLFEPFENVQISVPQEFQGVVIQELGKRGADVTSILPNASGTEVEFEANMPTRSIIGLKSLLMTETKGTVIIFSIFDSYKPVVKLQTKKTHGSIISTETGTSAGYSLENAWQRGVLFIDPAVEVYQGMVIGQCAKNEDLEINPCKGKAMSNVRSKSSDAAIFCPPRKDMGLEQCLEYIGDDELVEVTPINLRIRKKWLDPGERKRHVRKN